MSIKKNISFSTPGIKECVIGLFVMLCLWANSAYGADAVLEWDENSDAKYFVVYWSDDPDSFSDENSIEIPGDINFIELDKTQDGQQFYFAVKAFNDCGNSSEFSDQVLSDHIPVNVSYGDPIDTKTIIDTMNWDDEGNANGGGGCFIGSSMNN